MIRFIIRECEVLVKKGTILSGMRPTGACILAIISELWKTG